MSYTSLFCASFFLVTFIILWGEVGLWYCLVLSDIIWTNGHIFRTVLLNNFFPGSIFRTVLLNNFFPASIFRTVLSNNFFLAVFLELHCWIIFSWQLVYCHHLFPIQHRIKEHEALAKNREIVHSRSQLHTKFSSAYFDIFSVSFIIIIIITLSQHLKQYLS